MLRLKLSARAIRTLGGKALCMGFAEGHAGRLLVDLAQNQPGGLPPNSSSVDLQELRTYSQPAADNLRFRSLSSFGNKHKFKLGNIQI